MNAKMDLVVFDATGHVLAAAWRQEAGGTSDVGHFVGDGLWLRDPESGERRMVVSPDHLNVASIDRRDDILLTPRAFGLVEGLPEALSDQAPSVQLNGTNVVVTIPSAAPEDLEVSLIIEGAAGPAPIEQKVRIEDGQTVSDAEDLPLQAGIYTVLILVPGYRAVVVEEPV